MAENIYKAFGEEVRKLREEAGFTQGELAEKANIHQSELSAFEKTGSRIRGADRINQILSTLGFELQITQKKLCSRESLTGEY